MAKGYYVGSILEDFTERGAHWRREVFSCKCERTHDDVSHSQYRTVIGPFRTKKAAQDYLTALNALRAA